MALSAWRPSRASKARCSTSVVARRYRCAILRQPFSMSWGTRSKRSSARSLSARRRSGACSRTARRPASVWGGSRRTRSSTASTRRSGGTGRSSKGHRRPSCSSGARELPFMMRVGLTSPFAHPYVRRGVERYVHDLAAWLARRGHAVTIVATSPERSRGVTDDRGVVTRYRHSGGPLGRGRLRVDELLRAVPALAQGVRATQAEVFQCHHYVDAF